MPPRLSGWQNLRRCAELLDMDRTDAVNECMRVVELVGMKGREHARTSTYSRGMVQRFGLAAALLGNPGLLILDEPTAGLDPIGIREIRLLLESLRARG
jgi:ABC-2 type transport system ATP-binding protein